METWKEELYHYGILGMKWGVRRYQNPDGTRTPAGKKRYASTDVKNLSDDELNKRLKRAKLEKQYNDITNSKTNKTLDTLGKAGTVVSNAGQIANSSGQLSGNKKMTKVGVLVNQSGNAAQTVKKSSKVLSKKKADIDISKMSDEDLKKLVDRLDKEKQLRDIETSTIKTGFDMVNEILDYAGAVTAVGASALSIILAIKLLKG